MLPHLTAGSVIVLKKVSRSVLPGVVFLVLVVTLSFTATPLSAQEEVEIPTPATQPEPSENTESTEETAETTSEENEEATSESELEDNEPVSDSQEVISTENQGQPVTPANTQTCTWDGGGSDDNWSTAANWVGDVVPVPNCNIIFDGTSGDDARLDVPAYTANDFTIAEAYTGVFFNGKYRSRDRRYGHDY